MRKKRFGLVLISVMLLLSTTAFGQTFTGTISGHVTNENAGLPGVTITAKAAELIGSRTAVTGSNGDYVFANLPGGDYTLTFVMPSFQTVTKEHQRLGTGQTNTIDTSMSVAGVATTVTVAASSETVSQGAQQSTTYTGDLLSKLPTTRFPQCGGELVSTRTARTAPSRSRARSRSTTSSP